MTTLEFLSHLRSLEVRLWLDDDRLHYRAPDGVMTPALRAELVERKAEIIAFLRGAESVVRSISPSIRPISRQGKLPLSFVQQRLWFLDQLEPGTPVYNLPTALRIAGRLDAVALEDSLNEIVRRHEALRTTFVAVEGQPFQVIAPTLKLALPVVDLSGFAEAERESEARRLAVEEARQPFDLARGPLWRATLLRLSGEEHVLLLTMHHIIFDRWSTGVFFRELAALYEAFSTGKPAPLADLPVQYADFAVWQRDWLQDGVLEAQLSYWRKQLGDGPALLELPTDRPRPPVQTSAGATESFRVDKELTGKLRALGWQEGVSLYMIILAALQTLLYRYTGQEDISVGTYIAGRNRAEIEELIGFFVNTLVMRTDLSGNPTFRELLDRVREVTLGAYAHQDLPFEKLLEELQPERSLSHTPLFQVVLALQNTPRQVIELPGLTVQPFEVRWDVFAYFDLTLWLWEVDEGLVGSLEYNTDLFDAATIVRMVRHLQTLLEGIVANPEQHLSDLPLLTEAERRLLFEWNDTAADYPQDQCIHELFEAQAERTPDAVAVVFGDQHLTYRELNRRANRLAHYLRGLGVGPEVFVGLCVERSLEMVVGLLAILKAGGAYVPLDPMYPPERLAFMLKDSQVRVLLTQKGLVEVLPGQSVRVVCLDADWGDIAQESEENPISGVTAENLAYVIYTSGSTGKPKGAVIQHRSLVNFTEAVVLEWELNPGDCVLQFASISWDTSAEEIYPCLTRGAKLVLRTDSMLDSVNTFLQKCHGWAITVLNLPTAYWHELTARLDAEALVLPPSLRLVVVGGERALQERLEIWHKHVDQRVRLVNTYGATEATAITTMCPLSAEAGAVWREVPIGRPVRNVQTYVLDQYWQPVPIGVPGELYIGGAGLARGYLDRPELTAERFIPNPFTFPIPSVYGGEQGGGARLYRTGDLVRYLPDGHLEFLGRADHQVKVRGFRIELGEIETALGQHPGVRETVVLARNVEHDAGDKQLVAYVVPHSEQALGIGELRRFLREKLPDYMIPSAFVMLEALPLTPSGKVDHRALPAPDSARPELEEVFVAPRTPIEEMLSGIWAKVLGLKWVGIHDNFFELGGHSLIATQVISRIRQAFQVELPLRSLFQDPTVAGLAERIEAIRSAEEGLQAPPMMPVSRDQAIPLSFAQRRLWFLDQLAPGNVAYNTPVSLYLTGRLDVMALEQSLNEIIRRHEALRTTFAMVDGQPVQVIAPATTVTLPVVDLGELAEAEREAQAQQLAAEDARRPFDLARGPLVWATLLRLDDEEHVLLLNIHHIVFDGWSMGVFIQELTQLYRIFTTGESSPLPELPIQYADFTVWQRQWLQGEVLEAQLSYWKQQLGGDLPVLELPTDRPRPPVQTFQGTILPFALPDSLTEALKALSQREGCTLFMTLLAAFKVLLQRYTGQTDIVVGSPIANRNRSEIEGLIGFFVNTLVMRTDLSGNPTFREVLGRVCEVALGAYAHQDLPFEMLVEELQPERHLSRTPLFQVMFALQNAPTPTQELSGLTLSLVGVDSKTAKFDLTLAVWDTEQGLEGLFEYNTDLFDAATVARMLGHFQTLLEGIVANPEQRLSDLPLLTEAERRQLLVEWNHTETWYPRERCVHELFEAQVERTPDAVAVVFPSAGSGHGEDQHLTYRELNRRANQLAHYLRRLGVGPEVLVGICVERSLEMVTGLLGTLKAGGAYVPLDPAYPKDRLAFMLEDFQPLVLLTQARLLARLPQHKARLVCLDTHWETMARESTANPVSGVTADNLAYVIYTSGSTGQPKGVQIEHGSLLNLVFWHQRTFALSPADRATQIAGLSFDASVWEVWPCLAAGACLHFPDDETRTSPLRLQEWLLSRAITISFLPTPLAESVLSLPWPSASTLRTLLTGGDKLHAWPSPGLPFELVNNYGPTENTVVTTSVSLPPKEQAENSPPIGRPIANTEVYVLDAHLQPVPVGVPGELHIGGVGLARGYLNRPELTADKFIPHPFSQEPDARLYKTGDLVRYLPDGNIEFLGRMDYQVKIRGFRIELGEIETVLAQPEAVRETLVMARDDVAGEKQLVAYVVANQEPAPLASELRRFLREKLPDYMIPAAFVMLDAFPLTANGKVDRRALPAPERDSYGTESVLAAPSTPFEEILAEIWKEVLRLEQIGVHDNFFDLGGHSLLATQVVSRVRDRFEIELPVRSLFEAPTIAEMALQVEQALIAEIKALD